MSSAKNRSGESLVGVILQQRYVVLEAVGADGPAFRYAVYDTQALTRLHARVWDGDDELEIIEENTPLSPPPVPAVASEPAPRSGPAQPATPPQVVPPPPTQPRRTARPPAPTAPNKRPPLRNLKAALHRITPPMARDGGTPPPPPQVDPVSAARPSAPQPEASASLAEVITLADAVVAEMPPPLPRDAGVERCPPPLPASCGRPRTDVMEAAWFVQGEQLEPQLEEQSLVIADNQALEQLAADLPADTVSRYALNVASDRPPRKDRSWARLPFGRKSETPAEHRSTAWRRLAASPWTAAIAAGGAVGLVTSLVAVWASAGPSVAAPARTLPPPSSAVAVTGPPTASVTPAETNALSAPDQDPKPAVRKPAKRRLRRRATRSASNIKRRRGKRSWLRIKRDLRRARSAYRRDRYRRARFLAKRVLRLDPGNRRAAGLKRLAEAKLRF